jgi:hypothetical protein
MLEVPRFQLFVTFSPLLLSSVRSPCYTERSLSLSRIEWMSEALYPAGKRPELEAQYSVQVKNAWNYIFMV